MPTRYPSVETCSGRSRLYALLLGTLWSLLVSPAWPAPDFPALTGRVVDQANLLDSATETALTGQLAAHEAETSNQLVVATIPDLQGYDIADFGVRLGRHWQIGQTDKDNGVLLLVAPNARKVRIEVGYGLEGALPDALASNIIQRQILPAFREGDFSAGIRQGTTSIIQAIDGEYAWSPDDLRNRNPPQWFPLLFMGLVVASELVRRFVGRNFSNGAFPAAFAGIATTAVTSNLWLGILAAAAIFLVFGFLVNSAGSGTGTRRSSRNRNDGGFGGGGGGFSGGGGSFGGGGASGGW